jgi:hypothetical protein
MEEVDRDQPFGLGAQESAPRVATSRRVWPAVGSDACAGSYGAWRPRSGGRGGRVRPGWYHSPGILSSDAQDQPHHIVWCRWATRGSGLAPPGGDQSAVPAQQRSRRDDPMGAKHLGYEPGQGREHGPVSPLQPRSRVGSAQHRHLVTQQEDFRVLRRRGAGEQRQPREHLNQIWYSSRTITDIDHRAQTITRSREMAEFSTRTG